jgi:hypothetical protein
LEIIYVYADGIRLRRNKKMDEKMFYQTIFWYEMLLNVLLWIAYDPGRAFFGVYPWVGIVLVLLIGVPALLYIVIIRAKWL